MKNKFENEYLGEKLVKFSGDFTDKRSKSNCRRESTPIIVVCPPMEDSVKSSSEPRRARASRQNDCRTLDENSLKSSSSNDSMSGENHSEDNSCSASDTSSDGSDRPRRQRSMSFRKLFENLTLMTRSQSSSPSDRNRKSKKTPPKRLLRPPITYTYVRGLSGLPTQRVPRHLAYQYVT